jgi:hypothetical protein
LLFDIELDQQVLGLTAPRKVMRGRLDVESTQMHVNLSTPTAAARDSGEISTSVAEHPERR